MSGVKFLKNFLKNPTGVGAVWPTGEPLAKEIISTFVNCSNQNIAEIGPGTGAVTKFLAGEINKNNNFFAVEINTEFYEHLKDEFPGVKIYNDTAANLTEIINGIEHISKLDAVISGLPWASFPERLQVSILEAISDNLKKGGQFNTFAYLQGLYLPTGIKFKKLLSQYFSKIRISKTIWNNIPPAIVYKCIK